MKRGFGKGFFTGLLAALLVVGLGVSAVAAVRAIEVDDSIRVTINGASFTPKDANGREVPLFAYNGTTYAPVRAICEAVGLKVDFDSANYTAVLTTQDQYLASSPSAASYITAEQAKEIALNHAGVSAQNAIFVKAGLDWDDGREEYDVEFYAGNVEYDYDIDAKTGDIRTYDHDWDDFSLWRSAASSNSTTPVSGGTGSGSGTGSNTGTSTGTAQEDLISADRAKEIALAQAPAGCTVVRCSLDRDDGRMIYEVEMRSGRMEYECDVHAVTGVILDWDSDYDD